MAGGVLFYLKLSHLILWGVLESQAVLNMDESRNKEFAKKLRRDHVLLQVMHMHQRPGNQCLSWIKGDLSMLPPIAFPKTYGVNNCPMMARYHMEKVAKYRLPVPGRERLEEVER